MAGQLKTSAQCIFTEKYLCIFSDSSISYVNEGYISICVKLQTLKVRKLFHFMCLCVGLIWFKYSFQSECFCTFHSFYYKVTLNFAFLNCLFYVSATQITVEGKRGISYLGDIALDDFNMTAGACARKSQFLSSLFTTIEK